MRPRRRPWPCTSIAGSIRADEPGTRAALAAASDACQNGDVATENVLSSPALWARNCYPVLAVCGALLLAVGLVFGQTVRSGFVNFDDGFYVYENAHVLHGLSPREIVWAFTHLHAGYWIPLCWLSFMADNQFFGPGASGYHLTNVLLHAATTVLLFLVLRRMSGRSWPSATVAALFAVHPLHVESVAWVTERKDLLSGLCFVLALGAYDRYVRGPSSRGRYAAVVLFFVLGLMAKPMLVTLPVVLLLLDYWPLGRFSGGADSNPTPPRCNGAEADGNGPSRFSVPLDLIREKIPLFALAAVFCLVTAATEGKEASSNSLAFPWRVANALVSYVAYLDQLFCPLNLAAFYPHPEANLPFWKVAAAAAVLAGISAAAFISWRRYPYLLMGWLWYGVTLLPVIGLMQVGGQAMADRFTYVTQIGLYIALAWAAADVLRGARIVAGCAAARRPWGWLLSWVVRGGRRRFGRIRKRFGPMPWLVRGEISLPTMVSAASWPSKRNSMRPRSTIANHWKAGPITRRRTMV